MKRQLIGPVLCAVSALLSACGDSRSTTVPTIQAAPIAPPPPPTLPWTAIGPFIPAIQAPVAVHAASRKLYIATLGGGIYESDPVGTFSRSAAHTGLTALTMSSLAMDPRDPLTLYTGTLFGGIFKTTNGGASWSITGETSGITLFVALDPNNSNIIYAGYNGAVPLRKSIDGGQTWMAASNGIPQTSVFTLAIDPNNSNNLYAGSAGNGAFRSTNGGASWTVMDFDPTIWGLAIDPADSRVLYAGTNGNGVFRSTDSGLNWQRVGSPARGVVHTLLKSANRLIAGTATDGIYLSDDDGITWTPSRLSVGMILSLSVDSDGKLYAGTSRSGMLVSADNGLTWSGHPSYYELADCNCQNGHALTVHPRDRGRVLFSTNDGGLFDSASSAGRFTWLDTSPTLTTRSPRSIVVNPARPDSIYVGSFAGGGFFKSDDDGRTWQRRLFGPPTLHVTGIAVTPDGSTIFVTTLGGAGLWKSTDGGETFQRIDVATTGGPFTNIAGRGIAVDPTGGPNVYQAGSTGVWRSVDRGATWARISTVASLTINIHPVDRNTILVGTAANGVLKSTDSGDSFIPMNNGLTQLRTGRTGGVLVHRLKPDVYFVNTEGGGVFKSKDAGASWTEVNRGLGDFFGFGMAIDTHDPDVVYVATQKSVYRTSTGGE